MTGEIQFVPWIKNGLAAKTALPPDATGRRTAPNSVHVSVAVDGQPSTAPSPSPVAPVKILGPGDVVGVDAGQILRRVPKPDDHSLEPNYLAMIEFARPDLPWMFSPVNPDANHAEPWLMLAVLESSVATFTSRPSSPNRILVVSDATALPDPAQAWAFAHSQVVGVDVAGVEAKVRGPGHATARSRIICPSQLKENTGYVAVLLPTFEVGRLAGMGRESAAGAAFWTRAPGAIELPVYDEWRFHTGPRGDFEMLAEKLHALPAEKASRLGIRRVVVDPRAAAMQPGKDVDPGPDLFEPGVYDVATAISKDRGDNAYKNELSPDAAAPAAPAPVFHRELKGLLNTVAGADEAQPVVGPPLYGRWPALVTSLDGSAGDELGPAPMGVAQTWIRQLNADPGLRAAAGAGTLVVQQGQGAMMRAAWDQLSDVMAANRRIRWSRLSAAALAGVHASVVALRDESRLRLLSPAYGRVTAQATTVFSEVAASTVPIEATGAAMARVARYAVRAAATPRDVTTASVTASTVTALRDSNPAVLPRRLTDSALHHRQALDLAALSRLAMADPDLTENPDKARGLESVIRVADNSADLLRRWSETVTPTDGPGGVGVEVDIQQISDYVRRWIGEHMFTDPVVQELVAKLEDPGRPLSSIALDALNARLEAEGMPLLETDLGGVSLSFPDSGAGEFDLLVPDADTAGMARVGAVSDTMLGAVRTALGMANPSIASLVTPPGAVEVPAEDFTRLRELGEALQSNLTTVGAELVLPDVVRLSPETSGRLVSRVEPESAYGAMLTWAHEFGPAVIRRDLGQGAVSPFTPAMACPQFPEALVDRLRDLDKEWVLGGVHTMEPNTLCVLEVNRPFVESFLAGVNHEMARELLWRGYPTDLRGTCFRRFWNGPDRDILPLDHWAGPIGEHPETPRAELTIVVIKGDLLRRYPGTVVTAERGKVTSPDGPVPGFTANEVAAELFRGFLGDDVSYVGLDISFDRISEPEDATGSWYISMLEPHDEPRFGLDAESGGPNKPLGTVAPGNDTLAYEADTHDWSWPGIGHDVQHLTPGDLFAAGHPGLTNSAVVCASLFQTPFRVLLRAQTYLAR